MEFNNKNELTQRVAETFFNLEPSNFYAFYRKVLDNILQFWLSLKREKYIMEESENVNPELWFYINDWIVLTEFLY